MDGAEEFDMVFTAVLTRLYSRVAVMVGSRQVADDLVQDVYVRLKSTAYRRRRFATHPNPYGYALATALNLARAQWRSQWRLVPLPDDVSPTSDGGLSDAESWYDVTKLLTALTAKEAAVIVLVDLDGFTLQEAAALLGVHKGTAHRNRVRALAKLREHLTATDMTSSRQEHK